MLSLTQAAKAAGRSKVTIMRDIKNGKLSAARTDGGKGDWEIDAAELHRVYTPPVVVTAPDPAGSANGSHPVEIGLLRELLADREATIADLRSRLDAERDERRQVQLQLTAVLTPPAPKPWWKRLF